MGTDLQRFLDCMEYRPSDRRPNHELGVWGQTRARWCREAPAAVAQFKMQSWWDWFRGEPALGMDRREYIQVNFDFIPRYERRILQETEEYEIIRNERGIISKALKAGMVGGTRLSMDQYLLFPVEQPADLAAMKGRLAAAIPARYPRDLDARVAAWQTRDYPLVLGENCAIKGFYWRAREFMGTENLSFAWYDHPAMMHEMMAFFADFIIETCRPVLEKTKVDYVVFNEDMSMKGGPLLGPDTYREFIFPHMKRTVDFFRQHGVTYIAVDTDGDPTQLIPLLMDAGMDTIWPIERASEISPMGWRKKFGKSLRLWGGVDKRVLPRGRAAINAHLREFIPLIVEGGFIPTVDHTVPPDVSWDDFRYYMDAKQALLTGDFARLD